MADDLFALFAEKADERSDGLYTPEPIARLCFKAEGFLPVLICNGSLDPRIVVGEKLHEGKRYIICLADLRMENPPAKHLYRNLMAIEP